MVRAPFDALSPNDAEVALRSFGRRFRDAARAAVVDLDGEVDEQQLDEFAARAGTDGRSAVDIVAAVADRMVAAERAVHSALVSPSHRIDADLLVPTLAVAEHSGHLDHEVDRLERAATTFADRVDAADASHWLGSRQGSDGTPATPLAIVQAAVGAAVAALRDVERVLREVRGRG